MGGNELLHLLVYYLNSNRTQDVPVLMLRNSYDANRLSILSMLSKWMLILRSDQGRGGAISKLQREVSFSDGHAIFFSVSSWQEIF